jgi:hypothetical protein
MRRGRPKHLCVICTSAGPEELPGEARAKKAGVVARERRRRRYREYFQVGVGV